MTRAAFIILTVALVALAYVGTRDLNHRYAMEDRV